MQFGDVSRKTGYANPIDDENSIIWPYTVRLRGVDPKIWGLLFYYAVCYSRV